VLCAFDGTCRERVVDLRDEFVEDFRVNGLGQRVAIVVGEVEAQILLDKFASCLDLSLAESLWKNAYKWQHTNKSVSPEHGIINITQC